MDKDIKKYFDHLEVPYNQEHWTAMQQRLEIEELSKFAEQEDENFDALVKSKLKSFEPAYKEEHWQMMSEKLGSNSFRRTILRYKMLEAAIFLLLMWTAAMLFVNPIEKPYFTQNSNIQHFNEKLVSTKPTSNLVANLTQVEKPLVAQLTTNKVVDEIPVLGVQALKLPHATTKLSASFVTPSQHLETKSLQHFEQNRNMAIKTSMLQISNNKRKFDVSKNDNFRIGVFGSTAIDKYSPDNAEETKEHLNSYGFGVGGGFSLGWQSNSFEIETGAAYNSIKTIHFNNEETSNYNLANFNNGPDMTEKYLRLPIAMKYLFNKNASWKFYALGGGNVHINLNTDDLAATNTPTNTFASSRVLSDANTAAESLKNQDTFFSRLYYTANIGIGIEKSLTKRLSVFAQPEYFHQLFRPAIANGNISGQTNAFAISIGVKTSI